MREQFVKFSLSENSYCSYRIRVKSSNRKLVIFCHFSIRFHVFYSSVISTRYHDIRIKLFRVNWTVEVKEVNFEFNIKKKLFTVHTRKILKSELKKKKMRFLAKQIGIKYETCKCVTDTPYTLNTPREVDLYLLNCHRSTHRYFKRTL